MTDRVTLGKDRVTAFLELKIVCARESENQVCFKPLTVMKIAEKVGSTVILL